MLMFPAAEGFPLLDSPCFFPSSCSHHRSQPASRKSVLCHSRRWEHHAQPGDRTDHSPPGPLRFCLSETPLVTRGPVPRTAQGTALGYPSRQGFACPFLSKRAAVHHGLPSQRLLTTLLREGRAGQPANAVNGSFPYCRC